MPHAISICSAVVSFSIRQVALCIQFDAVIADTARANVVLAFAPRIQSLEMAGKSLMRKAKSALTRKRGNDHQRFVFTLRPACLGTIVVLQSYKIYCHTYTDTPFAELASISSPAHV